MSRPFLVLAAVLSCIATTGQAGPPVAPPSDLVVDYQGVRVADPYRALENLQAPETRTWARAQSAYARAQLDALPGLKALRERIDAADADQPAVVSAVRVTRRGQIFFLKRDPGQNDFKLWWRADAKGKDQLLLDPEAWKAKTGVAHAIANFTVSPDGLRVAAVIAKGDAELGELQVFDVLSGKRVGTPIPAIWGELPASWSADGRTLLYARGAGATEPGGQPFGKMQVFERRITGGEDRRILGWGAGFGPAVDEKDWVMTDPASAPGYLLAFLQKGVSANTRVTFATEKAVARDASTAPWTTLIDDADAVRGVAAFGRWVYALTYKDAPRYRVVRYDLDKPKAPPIEVHAQQPGVVESIAAAADGLYVVVRNASITNIVRIPHGLRTGRTVPVALPFPGAARLFDADPSVRGVMLSLEGWTRPREIFKAEGSGTTPAGLVAPSASRIGEDWVAEESTCRSHDGVEVPMSIIHRKGLAKDGSHPTIIDGYGGYGMAELAYFPRRLDAWFQRGGVFVDVKPRGGGAYGRPWYQAGVGPRKSNTWKDMIACGQAMVARGYTTPAKLAIQGTSMGGVAVGRAITERPDLFAVALVRVGITDPIRFIEATENGPNHEDEMGSLKTADGVRQLLAMSTYDQIRAGTSYPAVLFTAGMNDKRVAPWQAFKTFARMSAASASGRPILLRIDDEGGHGVTNTASQRNAELADRLAFVLWNTGDPAFQPPADQRAK